MKPRHPVFAIFLLFFMFSHAQAGDKKIGIIVYEGVLTSDVTAPLEVFGVASNLSWFKDYDVITIGVKDKATITTEEGLVLGVDSHIGESPDVDLLIVPSSYDMDPLLDNEQLISYIQHTSENASWLSSNCSGALLLAEAGILNGKNATTWAGGESNFQKLYPKVNVIHDRNMVIDDNVLTSNGSIVSYEAALVLLSKLSSVSKAEEVAAAIQYQRVATTDFLNASHQ